MIAFITESIDICWLLSTCYNSLLFKYAMPHSCCIFRDYIVFSILSPRSINFWLWYGYIARSFLQAFFSISSYAYSQLMDLFSIFDSPKTCNLDMVPIGWFKHYPHCIYRYLKVCPIFNQLLILWIYLYALFMENCVWHTDVIIPYIVSYSFSKLTCMVIFVSLYLWSSHTFLHILWFYLQFYMPQKHKHKYKSYYSANELVQKWVMLCTKDLSHFVLFWKFHLIV